MQGIQIIFQAMNVNTINSSSGIFFGRNIHINISSSSKFNDGFSISGDRNQVIKNCSIVNDNDALEVTSAS